MSVAFPYRVVVGWSEEDSAYVAEVPSLKGCSAHGASPAEAVDLVQQAAASILDVMAEDGLPAPAPDAHAAESGRLLLRLPRWLHHRLALMAEADGASLNAEIVALLAMALGVRTQASVEPLQPVVAEPRPEDPWRRLHLSTSSEEPTRRPAPKKAR